MKGAWKSTGRPSLTGFAEVKDAVAVRDWVHENVGVQSQFCLYQVSGATRRGSCVDRKLEYFGDWRGAVLIWYISGFRGISASGLDNLKNKLISALGRVEMHLIEGAGHFQMEGPGYE
ncbi:hypothetical protein MLD38_011791 [Melastoma candidum]|uniref:Uncharacterized protein n=1 Tax=Melastoma candidum TaxID=119954 RepID=A0ACB9R463_9MYRT|nr:hypothetical protein MLD38_011791 [Melastoma candidum]